MADHGPDSTPTQSNSAFKMRPKNLGKGNPIKDVVREQREVSKMRSEANRNRAWPNRSDGR